jgi:hypothetical protein
MEEDGMLDVGFVAGRQGQMEAEGRELKEGEGRAT